MKKVFSRKELIHEAIKGIRFDKSIFDDYHENYHRDKASSIISDLYFLGIINDDKHDWLFRIYIKMFY